MYLVDNHNEHFKIYEGVAEKSYPSRPRRGPGNAAKCKLLLKISSHFAAAKKGRVTIILRIDIV